MKARSNGKVIALIVVFVFVSVFVGRLATRLEPEWLIAGVLGLMAVGLVFYDYRIGVVCLTLLLPWSASALIPQTRGFNLINFLIVASVASLAIQRRLFRESGVRLPGVMFWCYLLPIAIAVFVAWPHLPEGSANFLAHRTDEVLDDPFKPMVYLKGLVIKPLFFVVYAFLTANAVRDSKRPELFFVAFGLSVVIPALAIIGDTLAGSNVADRKHFLSWGLQANSYGMLLALAAGPLLFLCVGSGPRLARLSSGAIFAIVSIALFLTASRGAVVAYIVILGIWLLRRRKFTDLILGVALAVALVFALPDQVQDRLTQGLEGAGSTDYGKGDDQLTMGRGYIWAMLAPDIWLSPIWGQGLNSTAWNSAVNAGRVFIGHPHNLYLAILLDVGILGFAAMMYLYYRYGRTFHALSREPTLSPVVRDYFGGAFASFFGFLAFCVTNGDYTPRPEQTYLWFALGFAFAYWRLGQRFGSSVRRKPFGLGVKRMPLPRAEQSQRH